MQFYERNQQENFAEIIKLIQSQSFCQLITVSSEGLPHVGIFNHHYDGDQFILHLNKNDEQIDDLKKRKKALVVFHDFLAVTPSYWVDKNYGGAATSYYLYAEFQCNVDIIETPEAMTSSLQSLLDQHQPEKGYDHLDPKSSLYKDSFSRISVLRLPITSLRTKWKLGQNWTKEKRVEIIEHFKARNQNNDLRAAEEMLKFM